MTKEDFTELVNFKLLGEPELMVNDFIEYWVESSLNGKKMRFQGEKYFDINRRFSTWKKMSKTLITNKPLNPQEATLSAYDQAKIDMGLG